MRDFCTILRKFEWQASHLRDLAEKRDVPEKLQDEYDMMQTRLNLMQSAYNKMPDQFFGESLVRCQEKFAEIRALFESVTGSRMQSAGWPGSRMQSGGWPVAPRAKQSREGPPTPPRCPKSVSILCRNLTIARRV
jgi:hypothetical protein